MDNILKNAYEYGLEFIEKGKVADYIPELAKVDKHASALAIIDQDGKLYSIGNDEDTFSIQSIVKVIIYLCALEISEEKVTQRCGIKGTALAFNSMQDLLLNSGKARNPMVNAGAMTMTGIVHEVHKEDTFDYILAKVRTMANRYDIEVSEEIYRSERDTAYGNRALINYMANNGYIDVENIDNIANCYFKLCSILVNVKDLANISYTLSNDGKNAEGKKVFDNKYGPVLRKIMAFCGMYDNSSEFAQEVGLPAKSGVGGGIITASKAGLGLATYSPGLDEAGNSLVGTKMLEIISKELDLDIY